MDLTYKKAISFSSHLWEEKDISSVVKTMNKSKPKINLLEGPPFVSGMPHPGHILNWVTKDFFRKFYLMMGYDVFDQMGFDEHGLPSEMKTNKDYKLTSKDVSDMPIKVYNKLCYELVMKYSKKWEPIHRSIGRWVSYEDSYHTSSNKFMESVWWVFKQLWNKGYVYHGLRVLSYSPACGTPLSNFEASLNYKTTNDDSVFVLMKMNDSKRYLVVWTTTPWTLPSNQALAVDLEGTYVVVEHEDKHLVVAKNALVNVFGKKKVKDLVIFDELKGDSLVNHLYEPIYNFNKQHEFRIYAGKFVKTESSGNSKVMGSGIVHISPAYGEDDFNLAQEVGLVKSNGEGIFITLNRDGKFTDEVPFVKGLYFKDAISEIMKDLKTKGLFFKKETYSHSVAYCYRTDEPLIYMALPSFFVAVTKLKEKMIKNNEKVTWHPEYVGKRRFKEWLTNAKDWGISRNRYFGTPIPVWVSDDGEEMVAVESCEDLAIKARLDYIPENLHPEFINDIKIPSSKGKGMLKRVKDVFDCWFESGSVPFAKNHFPFESETNEIKEDYLSDFVTEGMDQTRGWYYTLNILSAAITDKPAFKECLTTGMILDAKGEKMSKSKGNFVEPEKIIEEYGADSVRLYMLGSTALNGEPFRFNEADIKTLKSKLLPWISAYQFFEQFLEKYKEDFGDIDFSKYTETNNPMDRWIISIFGKFVDNFHSNFEKRKFSNIVNESLIFIDSLTNKYIQFNRDRLKGRRGKEEAVMALRVLWFVLYKFSIVMMPMTSFVSEYMYQKLKFYDREAKELCIQMSSPIKEEFPNFKNDHVQISYFWEVSNLVRNIRSSNTDISSRKTPLKKIIISHNDPFYLEHLSKVESYLLEELNVKEVVYESIGDKLTYYLVPNKKEIHKTFKKEAKNVIKFLEEIDKEFIVGLSSTQDSFTVTNNGKTYDIETKHYQIKPEITKKDNLTRLKDNLMVTIEKEELESAINEKNIRLIIGRINKLRKESGLVVTNKVNSYYATTSKYINHLIQSNKSMIEKNLGETIYPLEHKGKGLFIDEQINEVFYEVEGEIIHLVICKPY